MSENNQAVIVGRGLVKTFKDFWGRDKVKALKEVDIDIPRGSIFGLLGPNGAGKSTLIKLILGHLYPTAGQIAVFGKDPRDVNIKFQIGYLPERSYLYKNLTARETLSYFGEILNLSRQQIDSRTDQLLEMVGLQNSAKRYVGEFSHGMTRRMGIAQALLNDPDFIIFDEPTAGLDPVGCREVKDLIITLGQRGKTILLTSHLLADVEDTCDDVMMIFGGKVQSQGRLSELLADSQRTKLEFPTIDSETLEQVKKMIAAKTNEEVKVSAPKQSLESYFLKIVSEGNKHQETAGARQGSGVAAYLKTSLTDQSKETPRAAVRDKVKVTATDSGSSPVAGRQADQAGQSQREQQHQENELVTSKADIQDPPQTKGEVELKFEDKSTKQSLAKAAPVVSAVDALRAASDDEISAANIEDQQQNEADEDLDEDLLNKLNR